MLCLRISDVNDNAPAFDQISFEAHVTENNSPGVSIFSIKARDADWNQNARISYFLEETQINGNPASSFVSINTETGTIHAMRSFDYEQIKHHVSRNLSGCLARHIVSLHYTNVKSTYLELWT